MVIGLPPVLLADGQEWVSGAGQAVAHAFQNHHGQSVAETACADEHGVARLAEYIELKQPSEVWLLVGLVD
jgi:hypothetical protein